MFSNISSASISIAVYETTLYPLFLTIVHSVVQLKISSTSPQASGKCKVTSPNTGAKIKIIEL